MNTTIARLAQEAYAKLALGGDDRHSTAQIEEKSTWISPAPISVKMRIFCLPYAGGVSGNVFARWAMLAKRMKYNKLGTIDLHVQIAS
jgi:hypothetical protein